MPTSETIADLEWEGKRRLYPPLTNPNWLILRRRREIFREWLSGAGAASQVKVLDVGGRIQPYRSLLNARQLSYTAVDLRATPLVNVIADGSQLPFPSEHFDLVLCTQMLGYAPDPNRVVAEIYRVVKPRGALLLSVMSAFPRDSEDDKWRFLSPGIRQLLANFSNVQIRPEGGSIAGLARTVNVCLQLFATNRALREVISYTIIPCLNLSALALERLSGSQNDSFAVNYSVMARK